ncbi:hypothetical protein [Ureibacillus thermosphaericus]|uniref:hypothetical protein n=1 Tax=Ureibacillus thermosphaericus TaxID=51173 RepID=UPI000BBC4876|nr:hypothetical protein [Ureibacillus thermosphaericus]
MKFLTNFSVQAQVAIISGIVGLFVTLINLLVTVIMAKRNEKVSREISEKNIETLEKRRFIDAISMQRIEWINKLRDKFVEFISICTDLGMLTDSDISQRVKITDSEYKEKVTRLAAIKADIEFLLNPTEFFSIKLNQYILKIIDTLDKRDQSVFNTYMSNMQIIIFIGQVILKSEWKRIKVETEKGREIDEVEMAKIFNNVAEKIDAKKYKSIKKGKEWIEFEKLIEQ